MQSTRVEDLHLRRCFHEGYWLRYTEALDIFVRRKSAKNFSVADLRLRSYCATAWTR